MKKAIYIHGLASGSKSKTGKLLRQYLTDYEWTLPEVDHHCEESLQVLAQMIEELQPDLVCGTSLGGFYTICLADRIKCPMILVNPVLDAQQDIRQFLGTNRYFCKRLNGEKTFELTVEDLDAMRPAEFIQRQIAENQDRMAVFYSKSDDVLGHDYHKNYTDLFIHTKESTLMGHSMTEEFIANELKDFLNDPITKKLNEILDELFPEEDVYLFPEEDDVDWSFLKYKHSDLYKFEFSYMPRLVANMNEHPEDGAYAALRDNHKETEDILVNRWLKELSEDGGCAPLSPVAPQDYKVSKQYFPKSGKECLLIEFPEPENVPLAKYGLVCLNGEAKYRYFTLEISLSFLSNAIIWYLCSTNEQSHSNYGILDGEPTMENFIQAVENILFRG